MREGKKRRVLCSSPPSSHNLSSISPSSVFHSLGPVLYCVPCTLRIRVVLTSLKIRRIVQVARDPTRQRTERKLTKSSRLTPEATLPKVFSANARSNQSHQSSRLTPEANQQSPQLTLGANKQPSQLTLEANPQVFSAHARSRQTRLTL